MKVVTACLILLFVLSTCSKKDHAAEKLNGLIGPWDSYRAMLPGKTIEGPAPWMLCCYEQGFQLYGEGTYRPRYLTNNDPSLPLTTSQNDLLKGTWTLNKDTLIFYHAGTGQVEKFAFLLSQTSNGEITLSYPFGQVPKYFLKKR